MTNAFEYYLALGYLSLISKSSRRKTKTERHLLFLFVRVFSKQRIFQVGFSIEIQIVHTYYSHIVVVVEPYCVNNFGVF